MFLLFCQDLNRLINLLFRLPISKVNITAGFLFITLHIVSGMLY